MQRRNSNRIADYEGRQRRALLLVTLTAASTFSDVAAADTLGSNGGALIVQPTLSPVVELGLRNSPTFEALFERLNAAPQVHVDLQLRTPRAGSRTHSMLDVYREQRQLGGRRYTCVSRLEGTIFVPPVVSRREQIALLGHELLHVYRLLAGSRNESPKGRGERAALRLERQIRRELRASDKQIQAAVEMVDLRSFSSDLDLQCAARAS